MSTCEILTDAARKLGWQGAQTNIDGIMQPYQSNRKGEHISTFFKGLIESKFVRNESYFVYSAPRKKQNITSESFAKYCCEYEGEGSFSSICFFPKMSEITLICKSDSFPDELWETNYGSLKMDEAYIYKYKNGDFGTGSKNIFCRDSKGVKFIRVAKLANWYNSKEGRDLCDTYIKNLLIEKEPFRFKFQKMIEEAKETLSRYQKEKLNRKAIFYIDTESGVAGWSFDKQEVCVGDLVTLADGTTQTRVLYSIDA